MTQNLLIGMRYLLARFVHIPSGCIPPATKYRGHSAAMSTLDMVSCHSVCRSGSVGVPYKGLCGYAEEVVTDHPNLSNSVPLFPPPKR